MKEKNKATINNVQTIFTDKIYRFTSATFEWAKRTKCHSLFKYFIIFFSNYNSIHLSILKYREFFNSIH